MRSGLLLGLYVLLAFLALGGIGYLVSLFNSLIQVKNNINKAWSNIDVLLLQRNEELPKLIQLTQGYVQYERSLLESVTKLRSLYAAARRTDQKTRIENELAEKLSSLLGVWEGYPELGADEVFLRQQGRVSDLEGSIADRRVFFNETVKVYNVQREQFPQLIFAWIMGLRAHPYLDIPKDRKEEDGIFRPRTRAKAQ